MSETPQARNFFLRAMDVFRRGSSLPATRLLGGSYRPAAYPVLIGPGKCLKKGHRGFPGRQYDPTRWPTCTRCASDWDKIGAPLRTPSGPGMHLKDQ